MMRMTQATIALLLFAVVLWGGEIKAQTPPQVPPQNGENLKQQHYQDCMTMARSHPASALDSAKAWHGVGGGFPARHCALAAMMKLARYPDAATGFAKLAKDVKEDLNLKISLYQQAANAWFMAGQPDQAAKIGETILKLEPKSGNGLLIRAKAMGMTGKFWDAAEQLTRLLYAEPGNIDILVLRGSAYRQMGAPDLALTDFDQVIHLDTNNIEALLERGLIHFQANNMDKARADWETLIKAHPDDPVRKFAEKYLQKLDAAAKN